MFRPLYLFCTLVFVAYCDQLCGPCKIVTETVHYALNSKWMENIQYLLLHCSSLLPSQVCHHAFVVSKDYLDLFPEGELCAEHGLCHQHHSKTEDRTLARIESNSTDIDQDTVNILLSRVDSMEDFSSWASESRPLLRRATKYLGDIFPLLKSVHIKRHQEQSILRFINRYLMAVDYRLKVETGEGLRSQWAKMKEDKEMAQQKAFQLAEKWVLSNLRVFQQDKVMWEKYDVVAAKPRAGKGGEYSVQAGFGWTNGVILDLLSTYGDRMRFPDIHPPIIPVNKLFRNDIQLGPHHDAVVKSSSTQRREIAFTIISIIIAFSIHY